VGPDTVAVQSGNLTLTALVWRPAGLGPFPALIFSHGNYASRSSPGTIDDLLGSITSTSLLGPVFARNGYIFLGLFRRGTGLSKGQGESSQDLLLRSLKEKNLEERNELQVHLLETDQLQDMISGVRFLRGRRDVDTSRLGVIGHSFGGSLALILAEHDPSLKAVVGFGAAAYSWNLSSQLRARLTESVARMAAPVLLIHAQNDYSTSPADTLGAVMERLKKPHMVKIYPKFGNNTDVGHNFIFLGISIWERDVLRFLDENLRE
jgi:dienelactone hydrolase